MIDNNYPPKSPGINFTSIGEINAREEASLLDGIMAEDALKEAFRNSLAGHIITQFQINKDAKRQSGIEDEYLDSLRQYNGEYGKEDLQRIAIEGGSQVFMNLTATKCKTAKSWISDILQPSTGDKAWSIAPSPQASLPKEITEKIEASVDETINRKKKTAPEGEQPSLSQAQKTLADLNQERRDTTAAVENEIRKEAIFQLKKMDSQIHDQLVEGDWDDALMKFIEDFTIVPTAFMKGPIVTKKSKLVWKDGQPVTEKVYTFMNKRVDGLDMYPSPSATEINDGNLCEHVRYSYGDIAELKGAKGYKLDAINRVLDNPFTASWVDTGIEAEKAEEEKRGSDYDANKGIIHGIHFFGSVPVSLLRQWNNDPSFLPEKEENDVCEVEAILVGSEVIKCILNNDPLLRRPYYKASFYNRPGSYWGRSLPTMMNDIQRICNATVRALSNNLAVASGPQVEVYIDRLADNGDISAIEPMKIWQLMSDPSGGSGRAVNWFQPQSNAQELLTVYKDFEGRADDVTGIPRYAYGNEKTAGSITTLGGLSLLLESATKTVKDAIRNIDIGLIKPRIEFQFYYNLLQNHEDLKFTGDVVVIPKGSSTLTVKAAQQLRRNEFVQITSNPIDQGIMGVEGRAVVLRDMAKDLGYTEDIVPNALTLKQDQLDKEEAAQAAAQQAADLEAQKVSNGLEATKIQSGAQVEMHEATQAFAKIKLEAEMLNHDANRALEREKMALNSEDKAMNTMATMEGQKAAIESKEAMQTQEIAYNMKVGESAPEITNETGV